MFLVQLIKLDQLSGMKGIQPESSFHDESFGVHPVFEQQSDIGLKQTVRLLLKCNIM
jgi:hypothetical protein